jgi:DNA-binding transcriptional ArsR family regulator
MEYMRVTESTLAALAEPNRRRILDLLRDGERPVGELADALQIAQPSASKHLKTLKDAGLVAMRADAQRRWYGLRLEPLLELDAWLEPYRRIWSERLAALENHLDEMED